jgi:transposase
MTVIIGIDPHKATHTAVAIDSDEQAVARLEVCAGRAQTQRLLAWAAPLGAERTWAIESAGGLGKLLSQQLLAAGEHVVDVPPTLAARVRLLGSTKAAKNDANDALSTAIAGLRHCGLRAVHQDDHTTVLRLLAGRYDDLISLRTQAACRLHAVLRELIAGGAPRRLSADRAAKLLRSARPDSPVGLERKRLAVELLADVRRLDRELVAIKTRIGAAVATSNTALLELHGVGPIVAGIILAHVGDPARFATPGRFASYNATAPIEASSGPRTRHRLNPRGNRKLNHAMHLIAVTQIAHDTPGRVYYQRKLAEGKTTKEALRALKRRISDAVWRQLRLDLAAR